MNLADRWDYIVIGAGSAGCALCHELAKSHDARILVLEAGGHDRSIYLRIPAGQIRAICEHDWGFASQPDPTRNGRSEVWSGGRVLGGSSSINGMMYVRGAATDFDRWAAMGNVGWSHSDVLPIFRDIECSDQAGPLRGARGRMHVRTVREAHPLTDAFVQSAINCGLSFNADYNARRQDGVAYAQLSQRGLFRCSAADAFLKPLLGHGNLRLLLDSSVERIEVRDGRATGVVFRHGKDLRTVEGRHVVLCAGALNSPKLLMLSGIGEGTELERHGIQSVIERRGVGCNLREHPLIRLTYRMRVPSNNLTGGLLQMLRIGAQYLLERRGPLINLFEAAAFLRTSPTISMPDIQLHFLPIGYSPTVDGKIAPLDFPSVTVLMNKCHPQSKGRIRITSRNPADPPMIECRLLEDDSDLDTLVRGMELVRAIMNADPIASMVESEVTPGARMTSAATYVRDHTEIAYHAAGTCRMGADLEAVVTQQLRVVGVENLWIADASIMPDLVSGNTNAACMMIGAKLGRYFNEIVSG